MDLPLKKKKKHQVLISFPISKYLLQFNVLLLLEITTASSKSFVSDPKPREKVQISAEPRSTSFPEKVSLKLFLLKSRSHPNNKASFRFYIWPASFRMTF